MALFILGGKLFQFLLDYLGFKPRQPPSLVLGPTYVFRRLPRLTWGLGPSSPEGAIITLIIRYLFEEELGQQLLDIYLLEPPADTN